MRVWIVADVMKQGRHPKVLLLVLAEAITIALGNCEDPCHYAQRPQRVREPCMRGVGVGNMAHAELLQGPKSLEGQGVQNAPLRFREMDVPVNRIDYQLAPLDIRR